MKRATAILIIIAIILCAYPYAVRLFANGAIDRTAAEPEMSSWMRDIKDEAKVSEIVIPGSHDAGTAGFSWLAETQNRSIKDQLNAGTRYFDLRVQSTGKGLVFYHSVFKGNSYTEARSDILDFLALNPSEFVILDFQHFKGNDTQSLLAADIRENLEPFAVSNETGAPGAEFISSLSLADVRGKCIIFWGDENTLPDLNCVFLRNNDIGTRDDSCLQSFYIGDYNRRSSSWYIENALPEYINMRKDLSEGLFVLQGQLTDGLYIRGPRLREAGHNRNMSSYISSLAGSEDLGYINVIMRDYVGPSKNAEIIALNGAKGLL